MPELALPIVYLAAAVLILLEARFPAHPRLHRLGWYRRALLINAANLLVFVLVAGAMESLQLPSLLHLQGRVNPLAGASLGYFIFTFVVYWWHRLRHASGFCWRWFHQLHHSPAQIETLTAYFIHPLDMLANLLISNLIMFGLLGLGAEGAGWYTVITGIAGLVIHANIRLPRAVGYVFQTPEMHRLHHKSNHHAQNYSDIVWWDMLFGTWENPRSDVENCGFYPQQEARFVPMLLGRDVVSTEK